ncbi:multicopper oxidase family protein [Streptomyces palmae]|uniref:Multicopper oxidase family protein n=1 Tax=Streptomyces palmae TaxID=1701085 RepID=A0A4Z0HF62_9ACTN|nr:multicopper oxidase family protein [Streptomyces palmae]TGB18625.1 multicopper oxidase family protein [Streptomyces palmae]
MTRPTPRVAPALAALLLALGAAGLAEGARPEPPRLTHTAYRPAAADVHPAARSAGPLLRDPPELVSRHGVLRATIVVERRKVRVGDRRLYATTYNGSYMPPTLRVRPGDRIDLTLTNKADPHTNLHTHGLFVSPRAPSDDIFVSIRYGQSYHYAYRLPRDHPAGTYWYHSHAEMLAEPQVAGGESGVIVVAGLRRHLPPALRGITEHTIALKDFQVEGDAIKTRDLNISAPTHRTVNGQHQPVIPMRPGETQLWRLANIGANIYYRLHLPGSRFHVIAQDGVPVRRVRTEDTLLVPAGARFDVLVQAGEPGTTRLETLPYDTGPAGDRFPRADLATVVTGGTPVPREAIPRDFAPAEDLSHARIAARKTLVYTENAAGTVFFINGRTFDPRRTDLTATLGTVEEWTIRNDTDEDHSFHLHTDHFQLMRTNGRAEDPSHSVYDTVHVPRRGSVVIRVHFRKFTGRTVLHCHILQHEDRGMMAVLEILPRGSARRP